MSTDVVTFLSTETMIRWREPYVSEGLNKKMAVAVPWGTYRGFRLGEDSGAGDRTVNIEADASATDHVAVYQSATGYSMTVRRSGGDFLLDLSSYSSVTVIVTLWASYSPAAATTATIRTYTQAEWDAGPAEKDEVVVLGQVDVPASGAIAAADISMAGRRMAWQNKTTEHVAWVPLARNGSFAWSVEPVGVLATESRWGAVYWEKYLTVGTNAGWIVDDTDPAEGDLHLAFPYDSGTVTAYLKQYINVPVVVGRRIRIHFKKRMVQEATAGTFDFRVLFSDKDGSVAYSADVSIDTTIDTAYEDVDAIVEVPAGSVHLKYIDFQLVNAAFGATADAIRLDDVQVWMETSAELTNPQSQRKTVELSTGLILQDPDAQGFTSPSSALFAFEKDYPASNNLTARLTRTDRDRSASLEPPNLEVVGQLYNLGWGLCHDSAQALTPRITTPLLTGGWEDFVLLWEMDGANLSALGKYRIYAGVGAAAAQGWVVTHNAEWTSSGWQRDVTYSSHKMHVADASLRGFVLAGHGPSGTQPWLDNAWDSEHVIKPISRLAELDDMIVKILNTTTQSNPAPATAPSANALYAKNIVKAWARITTGSTPTVENGFNLSLHSPAYSGSEVWLDFNTAMADTDYAMVSTIVGVDDNVLALTAMATTSFRIRAWDISTHGQVDLSANERWISVVIIGEQSS